MVSLNGSFVYIVMNLISIEYYIINLGVLSSWLLSNFIFLLAPSFNDIIFIENKYFSTYIHL